MNRTYRKNFAAWVEMSPEDIGIIDRVIADTQNYLNQSRWEAIAQIFLWGFDAAAGKLKDEALKQDMRKLMVNRQLADVLDKERGYNKRVFNAVKELGMEETLRIAEREGMDMEAVKKIVEKAIPRESELAPTVQMGFWLEEVLKDGKRYEVKEIKEMAIKDGILPPENDKNWETHWGRMRAVASRKGWSRGGRQGVWQIKNG